MSTRASELLRRRLDNQQLTNPRFTAPADVVRHMGAVQSQDFAAAKWALGLRARDTTDRDVEEAFNRGDILRTHVLRPTWHFVSPADIRWMLQLTGPRVKVALGSWFRKLEIGERLATRSNDVLARALEGGSFATRAALAAALRRARAIRNAEDPLRVLALFLRAELDGVICSGPRHGKQFTYALLPERVPPARALTAEEARATLAERYFTSHGPATLRDFRWWSGLSAADAKSAVEAVGAPLSSFVLDGAVYWQPRSTPRPAGRASAHLIPVFDEAFLSYRGPRGAPAGSAAREGDYGRKIVSGGAILGTWDRTIRKNSVAVTARPLKPLSARAARAVRQAADAYGRFLDAPVALQFS